MNGTGNDIIALKAINIARTKQPQFYLKILSASEKGLYDQRFSGKMPFENFVWLAWSVKESAYKFLQRFTPTLVFSPTNTIIEALELPSQLWDVKLEGDAIEYCGFNEEAVYKGIIMLGTNRLYFRSLITVDFIFSTVNSVDSFESTCWGVKWLDSTDSSDQSLAVRAFLVDKLNSFIAGADLKINKDPSGCPILFNGSEETTIPVSLAHHGNYIAYSFWL